MEPGNPYMESRVQLIPSQAYTGILPGMESEMSAISAFIRKIDPITPYKEYIGPILCIFFKDCQKSYCCNISIFHSCYMINHGVMRQNLISPKNNQIFILT